MFRKDEPAFYILILWLAFVASFLALNTDFEYDYKTNFTDETEELQSQEKKSYLPEYVRGIYLTAYSAGNDEFRHSIIDKMKNGRINTVVIDIKDYSGYILYDSQIPEVQNIEAEHNRIHNAKKVIEEFHDANIYTIARQTVFQDPALAKNRPDLAIQTKAGNTWYDKSGLAWVDPAKQEVWEYNLAIAKEAIALGFDEINFDYMRYPSDGSIGNISYNIPEGETRVTMLDKFFKYLSDNLSGLVPISIDTFGLVMDHTDDDYDLGIGQRLDRVVHYFDYVSPMMYPSHYPLNYLGFTNSAEHPYDVIAYGLEISSSTSRSSRATIRPWVQAFNIRAVYDKAKIDAQAEAVESIDTTSGWLLWNARNYYPDYIFE